MRHAVNVKLCGCVKVAAESVLLVAFVVAAAAATGRKILPAVSGLVSSFGHARQMLRASEAAAHERRVPEASCGETEMTRAPILATATRGVQRSSRCKWVAPCAQYLAHAAAL